ncbi:MAG: hypothetical protein JSW70_04410 [Syntrophobacterales bacterium]|nr:MAG: hypothetical protein JSW70_04410 [Syntrophobacterales bacterium]
MKGNRFALGSFSVLVGLALITGCSSLGAERSASKDAPPVGERARYYHFEDVLIPHALKLEMDKSFIYENPSLKVGRLVFSGRVQAYSLVNFFTYNMEKDGWRLVNKFGFKDLVLNFSKENRNCTVNIYDRPINTIVEVWVGPVGEGG